MQPDSNFDSTLYKVFHPDKFDVSQLNLAPVGEVDERARYYGRGHRTVSLGPTAGRASLVPHHNLRIIFSCFCVIVC